MRQAPPRRLRHRPGPRPLGDRGLVHLRGELRHGAVPPAPEDRAQPLGTDAPARARAAGQERARRLEAPPRTCGSASSRLRATPMESGECRATWPTSADGLMDAGHEVEVVAPRHPERQARTEHLGGIWHFCDVTARKPGRPDRNRDWLTASAAAFDDLHAARPFDVVHSESTSASALADGVHRRVPVAAKFHGNYLGLAAATVRRGLRESGVRPRVREAKHLVWLTVGHVVPGDVVRFRACEAMVPSHQQVEGTVRSYLLDRSESMSSPTGSTPTSSSRGPRRRRAGSSDWGRPLFSSVSDASSGTRASRRRSPPSSASATPMRGSSSSARAGA